MVEHTLTSATNQLRRRITKTFRTPNDGHLFFACHLFAETSLAISACVSQHHNFASTRIHRKKNRECFVDVSFDHWIPWRFSSLGHVFHPVLSTFSALLKKMLPCALPRLLFQHLQKTVADVWKYEVILDYRVIPLTAVFHYGCHNFRHL